MGDKRATIIGGVAISFAAILWGLDGVVLTPQLHGLDINIVVLIFHFLPFILMNTFLFKEYKKLKTFSKSDYIFLGLLSLFGGAIGTMAIVKALFLVEFQKLTIVVLLQKLQPIFGIFLAHFILKEKTGKHYLLWAVIAITAGYFLTFGNNLPNFKTGSNTTYAALFALLAAFSFGSSTVFGKKVLQNHNFHTVTFFRYGFTSIIMLVIVIASGNILLIQNISPTHWIIFFIIAFTTGSGAIFLYYYGLMKVKAIVAIICELFFPISAIFFDYLINDYQLSSLQWISAIIMLSAIIQLNRKGTPRFMTWKRDKIIR
ncbi:MAG: DMT family transporter [Bacteroidota bacterium]|nr:DMT family transporter [Bacteroidota bacterium]